jgi:hypothetical protein
LPSINRPPEYRPGGAVIWENNMPKQHRQGGVGNPISRMNR